MAWIKYTHEQITELLKNKYVEKCSSKYITFTKEFKYMLLNMYDNGKYIKEIFELSWFPNYVINSKTPKRCLDRWRNNRMHKWRLEDKKWRKKAERIDISKMSKDKYIEYLETENAILKELKKLVDWEYP